MSLAAFLRPALLVRLLLSIYQLVQSTRLKPFSGLAVSWVNLCHTGKPLVVSSISRRQISNDVGRFSDPATCDQTAIRN